MPIDNYASFMESLKHYQRGKTVETIIMAAHTDDRNYAAYNMLKEKHTQFKRIIIFDYKMNRPRSDSDEYSSYYRLQNIHGAHYVPCDSNEADCDYLRKLPFPQSESVLVDITSISIPDVFRIFFVLKEIKGLKDFEVIYSEPMYYEYLNGFYFEYDEEIVQRDYRTIPEYFSSACSRKTMLVCFIGFERLVSKYIHELKEYSDVLIVNGFPAFYPKIKDISIEHNYELISTIGTDRIYYAQANDPFSAYNALCSIKVSNDRDLLDICVLGSKPMALGACLFALAHPDDVNVSFPYPKQTQKHSSIDVSDIWWYKFAV